MHRFASEVRIDASPAQVWTLLTSLDAYPTWTSNLVLSGDLRPDGPLDYALRLQRPTGPFRRFAFLAFVSVVVAERALRWTFGAPGLIAFEFSFELEPAGTGCRLRHAVETRRLLGRAVGSRLERQLKPGFEAFLGDVRRKFEPTVPLEPRPKPLSKPRPKSAIPPTLPRHRRGRAR